MSKMKKIESFKEFRDAMATQTLKSRWCLVTHSGVFHADDVMSTALLYHVFDKCKDRPGYKQPELVRVGDVDVLGDSIKADGREDDVYCIVYDIGHGVFDHHDEGEMLRSATKDEINPKVSGIPYAAFGLLWQEFGCVMSDDEGWRKWFDMMIVSQIDYQDNGRGTNPLSLFITAYNQNWDNNNWGGTKSDTQDDRFNLITKIMYDMIGTMLYRHESEVLAREAVKNAADNNINGVVVLDKYIPTNTLAAREDVRCIVAPSNREEGYFNIIIPEDFGRPTPRKELTEEYIFERDRPEGCTFVHKNLKLATFKNKGFALEAALAFVRTAYK